MKKFLRKQRIQNLVKGMDSIRESDCIKMYSNTYTVLKNLDNNYIIMVDEHGQKIALPDSELKMMVKKGIASFNNEVVKAMGGSGMGGMGQGGKPAMPIGSVSNGRRKIKEGVWVDIKSGQAHDHHEEGKSGKVHWAKYADKHDTANVKKINDAVRNNPNIDPKHYKEIGNKLQEWAQSKTEHKNMLHHHNEEAKAGAQSKGTLNTAYKQLDDKKAEHTNHLKDLHSMIKNAHKSSKGTE